LNRLRLSLSPLSATEDEEEGIRGEGSHVEVAAVVAHLETKPL
jgi:hypothetical protein